MPGLGVSLTSADKVLEHRRRGRLYNAQSVVICFFRSRVIYLGSSRHRRERQNMRILSRRERSIRACTR